MNEFKRIENLKGQVAVIFGGFGQVGFATAQRLANQQARVICVTRKSTSSHLEKIKDLPHHELLKHLVIEADLTDSNSLLKAVELVKNEAGGCDILVNTAGVTRTIRPVNLEQLTDDIFDEILAVNLRGVFSTIRSFEPLLKLSGSGLVINVSSTASLRASESNVAYAAAKAGLNLMTQTLAKALAPQIRFLAIVPGFMVEATSGAVKQPGFNEAVAKRTPLGRIGYADDIASTIEVCATSIRFATGSILTIDGGRTL